MVSNLQSYLTEFRLKAEQGVNETITENELDFNMRLIAEEFQEIAIAALTIKGSKVLVKGSPQPLDEGFPKEELRVMKEALLKEMADAIYTIVNMAVSFGWDIDTALQLVHISNMTKSFKLKNGKVQKGADYIAPNLEGCLDE